MTIESVLRTIEPNMAEVLAATHADDGKPIAMVNLLKFHPVARYPADAPEAAAHNSGRDAYRRYADAFVTLIQEFGGETVFWGDCKTWFIGQGEWDAIWINRFPSLNALQSASADVRYKDMSRHRIAGLAYQQAIMSRPSVQR